MFNFLWDKYHIVGQYPQNSLELINFGTLYKEFQQKIEELYEST